MESCAKRDKTETAALRELFEVRGIFGICHIVLDIRQSTVGPHVDLCANLFDLSIFDKWSWMVSRHRGITYNPIEEARGFDDGILSPDIHPWGGCLGLHPSLFGALLMLAPRLPMVGLPSIVRLLAFETTQKGLICSWGFELPQPMTCKEFRAQLH